MTIKVVAIKDGFYKGARIRSGQIFDYPKGAKLGKWMVPVDKAPKPAAPVASPRTLSEMGKSEAKAEEKRIKAKSVDDSLV